MYYYSPQSGIRLGPVQPAEAGRLLLPGPSLENVGGIICNPMWYKTKIDIMLNDGIISKYTIIKKIYV